MQATADASTLAAGGILLTAFSCACRDTPKLPLGELHDKLAAVPAWKPNERLTVISRSFVAKDFMAGDHWLYTASCLSPYKRRFQMHSQVLAYV